MTKAEKEIHNLLGTLKTTDEKDYSKEKLTDEEIEKLKAIMNSDFSDDNSEESDITENK